MPKYRYSRHSVFLPDELADASKEERLAYAIKKVRATLIVGDTGNDKWEIVADKGNEVTLKRKREAVDYSIEDIVASEALVVSQFVFEDLEENGLTREQKTTISNAIYTGLYLMRKMQCERDEFATKIMNYAARAIQKEQLTPELDPDIKMTYEMVEAHNK